MLFIKDDGSFVRLPLKKFLSSLLNEAFLKDKCFNLSIALQIPGRNYLEVSEFSESAQQPFDEIAPLSAVGSQKEYEMPETVKPFEGRVAVVTGSARGIGAAIAVRFAREGARVVVADIDADGARTTAQDIVSEGGEAIGVHADVSKADGVEQLARATNEAFGAVDTLVNNAGDVTITRHFLDADEEWWDYFMETNLKSQYLCIRRFVPQMVEAGRGCIINLSSGGATRSHRGMVAYDASKGGIEALTRSLALELAPYGIRVNSLVPGLIATHPNHLFPEARALRDATVPLGRGGLAEDLAGPAYFLASNDAAYVTGASLVVDGGLLVQQRSPQVDTFPVSNFPSVESIVGKS